MKIIGHATVVTLGSKHQVINDGAVAYDEKKIHAVGTTDELRKRFPKAKIKNVNGNYILHTSHPILKVIKKLILMK